MPSCNGSQAHGNHKAVGPDVDGSLETYQLSNSLQSALFGGVYEARGLSSQKQFAIKVLHKSELKRAETHPKQDFCEVPLSELRFQEQMKQLPHVVEVIEAFEDRWCHYIIFDLGVGGDLLEALKKKPSGFAESNAQYLIRMAAKGLRSLHERNLAMQDVSLENMLLFTDKGHRAWIKICDPGQAVLFESSENGCEQPVPWRGPVGKSFRPPELQYDRPYMATKVDSWCLGWSTFYLLVAQPLFMSVDTNDSGWRQFRSGDFSSLVDRKTLNSRRATLSAKAQDFVQRLMEIDPSRRMSMDDALNHPWLSESSQEVPPLLIGPELRLVDPPTRQLTMMDRSIKINGRGRSPSLQLRGCSPPNLRSHLPRQGSPIGTLLPFPRLSNRSPSPPQILMKPRVMHAWAEGTPRQTSRTRPSANDRMVPEGGLGKKGEVPVSKDNPVWIWSDFLKGKEVSNPTSPLIASRERTQPPRSARNEGAQKPQANLGRSDPQRSPSPVSFRGVHSLEAKPMGKYSRMACGNTREPQSPDPIAKRSIPEPANGVVSPGRATERQKPMVPRRMMQSPEAKATFASNGPKRKFEGRIGRALSPEPVTIKNGVVSTAHLHQRALSPVSQLLPNNFSFLRAMSPPPSTRMTKQSNDSPLLKWNPGVF